MPPPELVRADIAARAKARTVHSVVLAHTFASGGISSDSERDLSIGGVGAVPLDLFDGFGYTALGHLHGRQTLSTDGALFGLPAGLLVLRGEAPEGRLAGRRRRRPASPPSRRSLWEAPRALAVLRGTLDELLIDRGARLGRGAPTARSP